MTVKFWIFYREGYVRLKLREGEELCHHHGGPTDEGWSSYAERYWLEAGAVFREAVSDGRDCDGRLTQHSVARCPVERLAAHSYEDAPAGLPAWERVSAGQRDEYAEAMGY